MAPRTTLALFLVIAPLAAQAPLAEGPGAIHARLSAAPGAEAPFALAQRALWAFENGLDREAWSDLGALLTQEARPAVYPRLEAAAVERLLAEARGRSARERARWLLDRAAASRPGADDRAALARGALVPLAVARIAASDRSGAGPGAGSALLALLKDQAENGLGAERRRAGRRALLLCEAPERGFVHRLALRYPAGMRRGQVLADIRDAGKEKEAALVAVQALEQGDLSWGLRAAEVLAELPSSAALPALLEAKSNLAGQWGGALAGAARRAEPGPRAFAAFLTQQAYVRDFEVEVAQAASMARPVVGQVHHGAVLDVTVVSVQVHRFFVRYQRALDRALRACSRVEGVE